MNFSNEQIQALKESCGQQDCSLDELKKAYQQLERPKGNAVKVRELFFVSLEKAPNVQFYVTDCKNKDQLAFIEALKFVDSTRNEEGIWKFIFHEFWQGKTWYWKLWRFFQVLLPLIILNVVALFFATEQNIDNTFSALLTAISVFVAIFSLFTVSHEHLERKKLRLFENGKLAYYFSVDKNITKLGITAILACLLAGLLVENSLPSEITPNETNMFWQSLSNPKDWIILILLNIVVFNTFIVLRSIVEFYIHRPAEFILGDMKKTSLEDFKP